MIEKVYYATIDPSSGIKLVFPKEVKSEPYKKGASIKDDIVASSILHRIRRVV